MNVLHLLIPALIIAVALLYGWAVYRTYTVEHNPNQDRFEQGIPPATPLLGLYRGTVMGYGGSWRGKIFAEDDSGRNVFDDYGTVNERYPFKTYVASGIRDTKMQVLKIDYNLPDNPWWLRFVLDEVVEVAPNTLLGKLHIRAGQWALSLGYFTLEKSE